MIPGRSVGSGTIAEGYLELRGTRYVFRVTRIDGIRFGREVTCVIYNGENISAGSPNQINRLELSGLDFRLSGSGRLDLRTSPE